MSILQDEIAGDVGSVPYCPTCQSEDVVKDAWACWNPETGLWELENVFDDEFCKKCEVNIELAWKRSEAPPQVRIRELNDAFRMKGEGQGTVLVTQGIQAKGVPFMHEAMLAVRAFSAFGEANDPWGEHDFGAVELRGEKVFWKLDYYALDQCAASPNPANSAVTYRVLTIMLAAEY